MRTKHLSEFDTNEITVGLHFSFTCLDDGSGEAYHFNKNIINITCLKNCKCTLKIKKQFI